MTKVYLLLRNNKQSGPYTLEDLVKLNLKPLDLIWIEGKSFGWSYPSEITALKPFVAGVPETSQAAFSQDKSESRAQAQVDNRAYMPVEKPVVAPEEPAPPRKVYVSLPPNINRQAEPKIRQVENILADPADPIEQKAEELRKRIQSYAINPPTQATTEEPVVTKYSSTIPEREEVYTSWMYDQKVNKTKRITEVQKKWAAIIVAALLIVTAGFGISQYHHDKKELIAAETIAVTASSMPEPLITAPEPPSTTPITENNIANSTVENSTAENRTAGPAAEPSKKIIGNSFVSGKKPTPETQGLKPRNEINKKAIADKNVQKKVALNTSEETKVTEVKAAPKNETETVAAAPQKKKTLNQKVGAFFSKLTHKKEKAPVVETSPSPSNTQTFPGTVERKAVHRDDKPLDSFTPPVGINLAEYVEVTANKPSESWMLGIHGLKVSLRNTGSETVKTAEVELRYYTEQNEILDKKIVNFNNILPGKTVTLAAPDHRLADHADFRLVTAK